MKNRFAGWGLSVRCLAILGFLSLFSIAGTAAPLCVNGNTLAQYIAGGACAVSAGPVDLLFTFRANALQYATDGTGTLTPADIVITTVSNAPGNFAGLTFSSDKFEVPADGYWADVNLTFSVRVDPAAPSIYQLRSAHLDADMTATEDDLIFLVESELRTGAFNLQMILPDPSDDVKDAYYPYGFHTLRRSIRPNMDMFLAGPDAKVLSFTETFDLMTPTTIPEPGSMALIGGGLILAGVLRRRRVGKLMVVIAAVIAGSSTSQAYTLCTDTQAIAMAVSGTTVAPGTKLNLAAYQQFGTCAINDMLFTITGFTETHTGTFGLSTPLPTAGNYLTPDKSTGNAIMVDIISQPGDSNDFIGGFQFFPVVTTPRLATLTFSITFTVQAPTYQIVSFDGNAGGTSGIVRTVKVNAQSVTKTLPNNPSILLNDPLNTLYTVTDTYTMSQLKHISNIVDQFTEQVPEPVTSALSGVALIGLVAAVRRRKA